MLRKASELKKRSVGATDGEIGSVDDVYFDDQRWAVRYLVADTGNWLPGRKVLISPASLRSREELAGSAIPVALTRDEVKNSPDIDTDRPVSRQMEMRHASYFGYPYYWSGPYLWGPMSYPMMGTALARNPAKPLDPDQQAAIEAAVDAGDVHLRSSNEVTGYAIETPDGSLGHVEDLLVDDESWAVSQLVVDTRNWLPGKKVVVAPDEVEGIDWPDRTIRLRTRRESVKARPEYRG